VLSDQAGPCSSKRGAQHDEDEDRVVELAGDGDEVGHEIEGQRQVGDQRREQQLARAGDTLVAQQPLEENDAIGDEAGERPRVGSPAESEQREHEEQVQRQHPGGRDEEPFRHPASMEGRTGKDKGLQSRSAIVIGGGIGGISAALQLRRLGLSVAVFEQHEELSELNTGLSLWAFAIRRLDQLGLAEQLPQIGRPLERVVHRSLDGRLLGDIAVTPLSARIGAPSYEIHRSKLQRLLADALGAEAISCGRRCTGVEQHGDGVRAEFENGGSTSADLLIGADGVHSTVRGAIPTAAQTRLRRAEIAVWRGTAEVAEEHVPTGLHLRVIGPAGLFGVARLSDELVRWYAGAPFPPERPASAAELKQSALDTFARWPAHVRDILQQTDEDDYLFNDTPHAPPLPAWGHGRIALLGDAAHSSVPTLGISAGLAIEDAAVLAECLRAAGDELSGLRAYEAQRRPISARVVRSARVFGQLLMIRRQPAYALREIGMRIAPQGLAIRWLVGGGRLRQ
jgi:2-polyprenyl-6-methoxyphenol hydroxylase-like FAD-dependent oxidoreductase